MTRDEFTWLRAMLKQRSGLVLTEEKRYLLESRLAPLARKHGMASLSALVAALRAPDAERLRREVTEAMMINESFFFRDKTPFENFADVIVPALVAARGAEQRLRIWCAAAAGGQEPYSLAIQARELAPRLAGREVEIVATDLADEALTKAKSGLYTQFEVQRGMPVRLLVKYFRQEGDMWRIDPAVQAMVRFERVNLLDDFARLGCFDIVFCRNVLIYFDAGNKRGVLARVARQMPRDGYLGLGAAETVYGITDAFAPIPGTRGLYMPAVAEADEARAPAETQATHSAVAGGAA
jgi:chemotaxis protein methyltransferase CheR